MNVDTNLSHKVVRVSYDYDEVEHTYDGPKVPCRNCERMLFVKFVPSMGCYNCDAEPTNVEIRVKEA